MNVHLTVKSNNSKTGPIPVSTTTRKSCPSSCPMKANGCYAETGPISLHWRKVTAGERGTDWKTFCASIAKLPAGQLWRHNSSGDLPGINEKIDAKKLGALVRANEGRRGFTFTHKPMTEDNQALVALANKQGFTINLSADSMCEADELAALGVAPVVVVMPSDAKGDYRTPQGRHVFLCPATQTEGVTCMTCKMCSIPGRKPIIGFPAHGSGTKRVNIMLKAAA